MSIFKGKASGVSSSPAVIDESPPATSPKRISRGTGQQEALWAELVDGASHLIPEARAGTGKSSSCREGMWRILGRRSGARLRYLVYNRANADEFRVSCPPGVDVATSHSFGFQALKSAFRSNVEKTKTYLILDETRHGRNLPKYVRKSVALLVGHAKNANLDPAADDETLSRQLEALALHYDVSDYGRLPSLVEFAANALKRSAEWTEVIDFDDMIWLTALHKPALPSADVVFLDEVQDWNPAQHALIPLLLKAGSRVVAVGDRFQAINIFRGADVDSMDRLGGVLQGHRSMPLTITFRCPRSHVELANQYVGDLRARDGAPDGEVEDGVSIDDMLDRVQPGDLVICPTNAPVISGCLKLMGHKRPAYVRGRAVGDQLATILRGIGLEARTVAEVSKGVESWRAKELNRLALLDGVEDVIEGVNDRANGLQAVLSACDSPGDADVLIARLFSDDKRSNVVTFSTVHRAKGDEAENVWLIDVPMRQPTKRDWEERQQRNLRYVALTRSKDRLVFVDPPKRTEG